MIRWPNVFRANERARAEHHDVIGTDEKRPAVRPASVLLVRLFGCVTVKPDFSLASVRVTTMRLCLLKCQTALDGAG